MKKILSKVINGIEVIIATNDNNELKIGSLKSFNNKHMKAFSPQNDFWFHIEEDLYIHTSIQRNELLCNIGTEKELPMDNTKFPFEFLSFGELITLDEITA